MVASLARYRIHFNSEKNLGRNPKCNCYLGCGLSTVYHGTVDASLGEAATTQTGRLHNKAERTARLKRGWKAFKTQPDANGIPDTGDYIRIHRAMMPGYPDPEQLVTRDFGDVVDLSRAGFGISIAVRLSALAHDAPAQRYTRADHQQYLQRIIKGKDQFNDVCPMHGHSNVYDGHAVPFKDIRIASKAIENGTIYGWIYPRGEWTQGALEAAKVQDRLRAVRVDRNEAEAKVVKLSTKLGVARAHIADLESADPVNCEPTVRDAINDEMDALEVYASTRRQ